MVEKDPLDSLKQEEKETEEAIKKLEAERRKVTKEEEKGEVAWEMPQESFKKIMRDLGYRVGIDTITKVFFGGDTDSVAWLDEVLKLSNIPAKNRKLMITSYFGKTPEELGYKVEPYVPGAGKEKLEKAVERTAELEIDDITKMADEDIKNLLKGEKTRAALAQIRSLRTEAEERERRVLQASIQQSQSVQPQQQIIMRQVTRPAFKDGAVLKNPDGSIVYETIAEPVNMNQPGGLDGGLYTIIAALLTKREEPVSDKLVDKFTEGLKSMDNKIEALRADNAIRTKEDEIKRLQDETRRKEDEHKRDLERKESEFKDRLDRLDTERIRDLDQLEKRFKDTVEHRQEMEKIVGTLSDTHKKEMDDIKKRLESAQGNIEKTIVSKSTETADKMVTKVGDIADSVIKPMTEVLRDHYATIIDQQRKSLGLPDLKSTVPKVSDSELEEFVKR